MAKKIKAKKKTKLVAVKKPKTLKEHILHHARKIKKLFKR